MLSADAGQGTAAAGKELGAGGRATEPEAEEEAASAADLKDKSLQLLKRCYANYKAPPGDACPIHALSKVHQCMPVAV